MMGVPLTELTYVYFDNMYVIYNTSRPESILNKKRNSICYHAVPESVASGECFTTHCKTGEDYSDMMTKVIYGQKKRDNVSHIIYDIWDHKDVPEPAKELLFCLPVCHDQDPDGTCLHVCFSCLYAMTKTTAEPVWVYFRFKKSTSI